MLLDRSIPNSGATICWTKPCPPFFARFARPTLPAGIKSTRLSKSSFAELGAADKTSTLAALRAKATGILQSVLRPEEISHLRIAFHCFPDEWGQDHTGVPIEKLYPDLVQRDESRKIPERSSASRMCWGVRWR